MIMNFLLFLKNQFIKQEQWGQPVNKKVYKSWDDACADLDKWEE